MGRVCDREDRSAGGRASRIETDRRAAHTDDGADHHRFVVLVVEQFVQFDLHEHDHGVDVLLTGHDHGYERFAPMDPRPSSSPPASASTGRAAS